MPKKLVLQGDVPGITLDHYHKLDLTLEPDDIHHRSIVNWLVTTGTVTVNIDAPGPGFTLFEQLLETDNVLTTVTVTGDAPSLVNPFGFGNANTRRLCGDRHRCHGDITDHDPFFAEPHRCDGNDRTNIYLCRCRKHQRPLIH